MLLAQSISKHNAVLFLAQSIYQIQEPAASGCGCIWGAVTHSGASRVQQIHHRAHLAETSPSLPFPHAHIVALCESPAPGNLFCSEQAFMSPTEEQTKELWSQTLNSALKDRTRIRAAHFLTVASLWPPTDCLTFYLHLSHHHKKLLFILQSKCLCAI